MSVKVFQSDAPLDERRVIIRRHDGDVEMVELPWGLRPRDGGPRAVNVVRSEGRTFPTYRCLAPASEFRHKSFSFSLANRDWFYFAGIWRPATDNWPEAYSILTIEANADIGGRTRLVRNRTLAKFMQIFRNLRSVLKHESLG